MVEPCPEPFMTSFLDEPFPMRKIDFQFGAPGEVGEVGPLGGDRVPSGEAVVPFLAVAGMVGAGGGIGGWERERGRRRRRRGRELLASVVVESKGQGSNELGTLHLLPPRSKPSFWSPLYRIRPQLTNSAHTLSKHLLLHSVVLCIILSTTLSVGIWSFHAL